eukprot:6158573-Prymnesium_polylepis.1
MDGPPAKGEGRKNGSSSHRARWSHAPALRRWDAKQSLHPRPLPMAAAPRGSRARAARAVRAARAGSHGSVHACAGWLRSEGACGGVART